MLASIGEGLRMLYDRGYRVRLNEDDSFTVTCPPQYGELLLISSSKDDSEDYPYVMAMRLEAIQIEREGSFVLYVISFFSLFYY